MPRAHVVFGRHAVFGRHGLCSALKGGPASDFFWATITVRLIALPCFDRKAYGSAIAIIVLYCSTKRTVVVVNVVLSLELTVEGRPRCLWLSCLGTWTIVDAADQSYNSIIDPIIDRSLRLVFRINGPAVSPRCGGSSPFWSVRSVTKVCSRVCILHPPLAFSFPSFVCAPKCCSDFPTVLIHVDGCVAHAVRSVLVWLW
jgi:hypothetical protein